MAAASTPISRRRGRRKGGATDQELGRSRGGKPVVRALTAGQRHESPQVILLLEWALERMWSDAVAGDKKYSAAELRAWLADHEIAAVIPKRKEETGPNDYVRAAYCELPIIERTLSRLKRYRRIATRHEKLTSSHLAMVTLVCILEWL